MKKADRAQQARRELDEKFAAQLLESIRTRPGSGWIRAIRQALGLSQADLARRVGVSSGAINKLEHAEVPGGITISKLSQIARALDCSLVYALVPNSTLEETVMKQARSKARELLRHTADTMVLKDQPIDEGRHDEALEITARQLVASGKLWSTSRPSRQPLS